MVGLSQGLLLGARFIENSNMNILVPDTGTHHQNTGFCLSVLPQSSVAVAPWRLVTNEDCHTVTRGVLEMGHNLC